MSLRLVIFDVDGTLVDSQNHIHAAMTEGFRSAGHAPPPLDRVLSIVGLSLPEAVAVLAPDLPPAERDAIVAAYKASFQRLRVAGLAPLYPGAREALVTLSARPGLDLGIATGKSRRGLTHILSAHDLARMFVTTQVADDHPSKPHPAMLHAALEQAGVDAAEAVMVGDTTYDVEMAQAAGMAAIGVGWGYHSAPALVAAGAVAVVADFAGLLDRIDALTVRTSA
ncbi:HAD-IA family hydrolase [Frigidibacter oleivorans]|uniref:HAD-IA family hydrolase n=1 Tax=Frigidibacter oleivorans TaxID=2487129 RepID=UPI002E254BB3